jgi:hypothetical protein
VRLTTIEIDIDVYKVIEARRISFDESHNDILRRDYKIGGELPIGARTLAATPTDRVKQTRKSGNYGATWRGGGVTANSLKRILKETILKLAKDNPALVENLSKHRTTRGRRIVARKPEELYPGNPHLVEHGAERLDSRWWYDTNVSTNQCRKYLGVIGQISGAGVINLDKQP